MILDRILALFHPDSTPAPLPEPDAHLALAALLVRVAKSDGVYRTEEIARIDRILAQREGINPVEAAKLRATAEKIEAAAPDTPAFARLIRDATGYEDRLRVARALWQVSLADGITRAEEERVVNIVDDVLGLSEHDAQEARMLASHDMTSAPEGGA